MSTERISLTNEGGEWTAVHEQTGAKGLGRTRTQALDALDAALDSDREDGTEDGASGDPFFAVDPVASGGPTDVSERADRHLVGAPASGETADARDE